MAPKLVVLGALLAVAAVALAAYVVVREPPASADLTARLEALETEVARLAHAVETLQERPPALRGVGGGAAAVARGAAEGDAPVRGADAVPGATGSGLDEAQRETLESLVEDAVDRKALAVAAEWRAKADKKPPIDVFADTLGLTPEQRLAAEQEILRGQREVYGILDTPTNDGRNLMDELVEVVAGSIANPADKSGWARFFGRVVTERFPGTDDTYATRIEAVKTSVRAALERAWTPEQYAEFTAWGVDPTEVKGIEGSPSATLERRVIERARALGVDVPDEGSKAQR